MKLQSLYIFAFLFFFICSHEYLFAQNTLADSNYIYKFEKRNVVELYPGISSTKFNFSNPGQLKNNYSLVANRSGNIGIYLGYKWVSLKYSWAIPGTQLDKNVKLQYKSLGFNFRIKKWNIKPFYNSYNGLLLPEKPRSRDFKPIRDIKFSDAGVDFFYFFRTNKFSIAAANSFSEKQIKSYGSFFLKITPMWQKINWQDPSRDLITDSTTYTLLSYDPEWISLIARIGYNHNFSFKKGKWSIAPFLVLGGGALREINTGTHHLQLVTDMQGGIRAGYNGHHYYIYLNARWGNLQTNLIIKNMHQVNTNFSITGGYRFRSLKKKILHIL
ncbi:MAG: DUF4421 family protein [Ferruginibacter sp.]